MANHVHKQLRDAVATLVTGLATTGTRVFKERVYPFQSAELPGLCVYLRSEEAELATIHQPLYSRSPQVVVEGYVKASTTLEDTLDQVKKEVEIALSALTTVSGKAVNFRYEGCDTGYSAEGDKPHGVVTLNYRATLFTAAGQPDLLL